MPLQIYITASVTQILIFFSFRSPAILIYRRNLHGVRFFFFVFFFWSYYDCVGTIYNISNKNYLMLSRSIRLWLTTMIALRIIYVLKNTQYYMFSAVVCIIIPKWDEIQFFPPTVEYDIVTVPLIFHRNRSFANISGCGYLLSP